MQTVKRCRRRACPSLVKCRKTFGARLDRAAADRHSSRTPVDPRKAWRAPSAESRKAQNSHRSRLRRSFYALVKENGLGNTQVVLTGVTPGGEFKFANAPAQHQAQARVSAGAFHLLALPIITTD